MSKGKLTHIIVRKWMHAPNAFDQVFNKNIMLNAQASLVIR